MLSKLWRKALNLLASPRNPAPGQHCSPQVEELEPRVLLSSTNLGTLTGLRTFHDGVSFLSGERSDDRTFTLAVQATLSAKLENLDHDCDLTLMDSAGNVLAQSNRANIDSEFITASLDPGSYKLVVGFRDAQPDTHPFTDYDLAISADRAGQTLGTARDLGTVAGFQSLFDFVGNPTFNSQNPAFDPEDFYKFTTFTPSAISVTLSGLTADADLRLIPDADNDGAVDPGEVIASTIRGGTSPETISVGPGASGTFFLRVNASTLEVQTNYLLLLTVTPLDGAGNTLATARLVSSSAQSAQQFSDFVGGIDRDDFYKVPLVGPGPFNFTATLNGLTADANLELIHDTSNIGFIDSGETLAPSTNTGTSPETINMTLFVAGTYFVRVRQGSGDTAYTLTLQAVSTDTAGNTLADARNIGTLNGKQTFTQFVGNIDTLDFYKFTYAAPGPFTALLSDLSKNADLVLIQDTNPDGKFGTGDFFVTSANGSNANETINLSLSTGVYFVLVRQVLGDTNYTLTLTADYAGNTLTSARLVGPGTYKDFVGSSDADDFYRITLAGDSRLIATQVGLPTTGRFQLSRNLNNNQIIENDEVLAPDDVQNNGTSTQFVNVLAAGTYYVRISAFTGEANYTLFLDFTPVSGSISGRVFEDTNGDGAVGALEPGLANLRVFLDANGNGTFEAGERFAITGANGAYSIASLSGGTYSVRQVTPPGFLNTPILPANGGYTVTLAPGQNVAGKNFADVRPASISGSVFNDLNGNAIRDAIDTALPNWTIFVDTNNNLVLDAGEPSTASNSLGNYSLANVRPGPVFQVLQAGFTQTLPLPIGNYTLLSGQNLSGRNFAFSKLIVDNTDPNVLITGTWRSSTQFPGFFGANYLIDENSGKGKKSVRFTANIPVTGSYEVFARWTANSNRANNTPIDIVHRDGIKVVTVNQQQNGGVFVSLGTFFFSAGPNGIVVVRNGGTSDQVVADAVQFIRQPPVAPSNLTATVLSDSQIQLSWSDNSLSEAGFKIQRSTHPLFKEFDEITLPTPGVTSFTDTLDPHRTYYYRVLAYGVSGASIVSNVVNVRMSSKLLAAAIGSWIELVDGAEDLEHGPQDWPRTSWI